MKAAVWYSAGDIRVEDVAEPEIKEGTVKIAVEWCGICGSDLHEYIAGPITIPASDTPHPLTGQVAPVILGHEFSGQIVEIGSGVTNLKIGDRVAVEPLLTCGTCHSCKIGYYNLCEKRGFHGLTSDGGGLSDFTVVPAHLAYKLPDTLSYEEGAIVEPASVAVHAVRQSPLKIGDTCVVFGAGPIGLLLIQAVKAAGASKIISVEISKKRLEKAMEVGATDVINPKDKDVLEEVLNITGGIGADVTFEAAGVEDAFLTSVKCLKPSGEAVIVSLWEKTISLDPNLLVMRECKINSSAAFRNIFPEVISLIADGKINAKAIITKQIKLADVVEGFKTLIEDKSHSKIIVTPK